MTTVVFPAAHKRGGVERIAWEMLRHFGAQPGSATFVGGELLRDGLPAGVGHLPVDGGERSSPSSFRRQAATALAAARGAGGAGGAELGKVLSLGVNCPPGDILVVNSLHCAWLMQGRPATVRGIAVPNAVRYLMPRHRELLKLESSYFASRDAQVVAVSEVVGRQLQELYAVDPRRVTVIPNGYDPAQCSDQRRRSLRDAMRARYGIGVDDIALLFVANELHRKGLAALLDSVGALADPRVSVHVVGKTPLGSFAQQVERLGLAGRVHHHGATDDIGQFHALADALVLPTQYEAFALTIVEALASGLPVITTSVPGAGDCITHGVNGLLQHDPMDVEELTALLHELLDPSTRQRLGAAAPASVAALSWERLMERFEPLIGASA